MKSADVKQVTIYLPNALAARLADLAHADRRSLSAYVLLLLERASPAPRRPDAGELLGSVPRRAPDPPPASSLEMGPTVDVDNVLRYEGRREIPIAGAADRFSVRAKAGGFKVFDAMIGDTLENEPFKTRGPAERKADKLNTEHRLRATNGGKLPSSRAGRAAR